MITVDLISNIPTAQFILSFFSLLSVYLIERGMRSGYLVGLLHQPLWWYVSLYQDQQWGLSPIHVGMLYIWCKGVYNRYWRVD